MSKREKIIYRRGQIDMLKTVFGSIAIAAMFATIFGQAFMF